ncbi:MAG: cation diffusion facilitator family transporter [Anaerolineae bacterium]
MERSNKRAIFISLGGNIIISLSKFVAAFFTGSAGMMSEAIHSLADTSHELLLLVGVRQAEAKADDRFPYGQGKAVYFWGLIAVIFFGVGGVLAINDGWHQLFDPEPVEWPWVVIAVLAVTMVMDGVALWEATVQFVQTKGEKVGFWSAMRTTKDPSMRILIFENAFDILGESVALVGIALFLVTGDTVFDAVAGIVVGISLVCAALWQAMQIKHLLIGTSGDEHVIGGIREIVTSYTQVADVEEISSLHMGPDVLLVNIRVRFAEEVDVPQADYLTHHLERQIEDTYPIVKYVYVKSARRPLVFEPQLQLLSRKSELEQKAS